jgi:hypothetical protein
MGLMRDYLAILRATAKYARALKDYYGMIFHINRNFSASNIVY